MSAAKLKLVEPAPMTVEQAAAAVEVARAAVHQAAAGVNAAVDRWPAPNNIRRMIEERRVTNPPQVYSDHNGRPDGQVERDRYKQFDIAVAAEVEADNALAAAKATLVEAKRLELGDGRKALATAIDARARATSAADTARAAVTRARGEVRQAEERLGAAESAVEVARAAHVAFLTSETDEVRAGREDVRAARREHTDAIDDVEMARQALNTLKAAAEDAEDMERRAINKVDEAARAVLAEAVIPLLDGFDEGLLAWKAKTLCRLNFVKAALPTMFGYGSAEAARASKASGLIAQIAAVGPQVGLSDRGPLGADLFASALTALKLDAAATLPEIP